jgi:hypothetical protein
MLLLEAGYGAGNGPGMALLARQNEVDPRLEEILLSYSCHPPALPKIRECLEASKRYDCWVQPGWIYCYHDELLVELRAIGIEVFITSLPAHDRGRLIVRQPTTPH